MEEDSSDPEYYYYYYYGGQTLDNYLPPQVDLYFSSDYLDSGIDISHELSTYEPLPTPLPLGEHQDKSREDVETKKTNEKE